VPTWKLVLEYDGTRYSGWQEQKNARTVSGEIRIAAEKILGKDITLDGAGRTDAGVHALAQVARIKAHRKIGAKSLHKDLSNELPKDIGLLQVQELNRPFHPRHDAVSRYYLYQISTRRTAFAKPFVWWVRDQLSLDSMQQAASFLVGRHNFERFCDKRMEDHSPIVVVEDVELAPHGDLILFRIGASHFLWRMVRRVMGVLAEVGRGNLTPDEFQSLIGARAVPQKLQSFSIAAHTAPASGLFLERITYDASETPGPLAPAFPVPHY
jgi:tRNA pseudouridine38-40 synthase